MKLRIFSTALWALTCLLVTPAALRAQAQPPPVVKSIEVRQEGSQTVAKEKILANMRTRVGRPYSPLVTQEDIRSL